MNLARQPVLLVEDLKPDALLFQRAWERLTRSKSVRIVSTGDEAIPYLSGAVPFEDRRVHPIPSLVFLDLNLPGMPGFEVLAWIQQNLRRVRVIVLTGSSKTLDVYRAFELGASTYLVKPVTPEGLNHIQKALRKRRLPRLLGRGQPSGAGVSLLQERANGRASKVSA